MVAIRTYIGFTPFHHKVQNGNKAVPHFAERVLNPGRYSPINLSMQKSIVGG
ncbi:hypothetical protein K420107F6_37990 [Lactonifactor longoviformis]